jgi:hypothetical protein
MTAPAMRGVWQPPRVGRGRESRQFGVAALALFALGLALTAAGCGSAKTFTAQEFVDRIQQEGVAIRLGPRMPSGGDAQGVYSVTLPPLTGEPAPPPGSDSGPGASGSLYVFGDTGGAEDELTACRASGGLLCFRAANIVVVLDNEGSGLEPQRLGVAIRRVAGQ